MVDEKLLRNCLILLDKEFNIEKQKESTSIWVIKEELVSDPENFREGSHILNQYMS